MDCGLKHQLFLLLVFQLPLIPDLLFVELSPYSYADSISLQYAQLLLNCKIHWEPAMHIRSMFIRIRRQFAVVVQIAVEITSKAMNDSICLHYKSALGLPIEFRLWLYGVLKSPHLFHIIGRQIEVMQGNYIILLSILQTQFSMDCWTTDGGTVGWVGLRNAYGFGGEVSFCPEETLRTELIVSETTKEFWQKDVCCLWRLPLPHVGEDNFYISPLVLFDPPLEALNRVRVLLYCVDVYWPVCFLGCVHRTVNQLASSTSNIKYSYRAFRNKLLEGLT